MLQHQKYLATPEVSPQRRLQEYDANGDIIVGLVFTWRFKTWLYNWRSAI
jgi:hypothetical protein